MDENRENGFNLVLAAVLFQIFEDFELDQVFHVFGFSFYSDWDKK